MNSLLLNNVIISGLTASGKTSVATRLCTAMGRKYISASGVLLDDGIVLGCGSISRSDRTGHYWLSDAANIFNNIRLGNNSIDKGVDDKIVALLSLESNLVCDCLVAPAIIPDDSSCLKILLDIPFEYRVKRSMQKKETNFDYKKGGKLILSKDKILHEIAMNNWDIDIFSDKYKSCFDVIIDNSVLDDVGNIASSKVYSRTQTINLLTFIISGYFNTKCNVDVTELAKLLNRSPGLVKKIPSRILLPI